MDYEVKLPGSLVNHRSWRDRLRPVRTDHLLVSHLCAQILQVHSGSDIDNRSAHVMETFV